METIYYRGILKSCNYSCSYCPFARKPFSQRQMEKDREALGRFCDELGAYRGVGVMFLPYGEAMIHSHYLEQFGRLSRDENIRFVACQTNLSFAVKDLDEYAICYDKLKLWCSFHPGQVTVDDFLARCEALIRRKISFCVGAVGDVAALPQIEELRRRLPDDIYLWINDMEGKKRAYTETEIAAFGRIDPYFPLELSHVKADISRCMGGKQSVFVMGNGDVYACNVSGCRLGNLYSEQGLAGIIPACRSAECRCYLAYSQRLDLTMMDVFGENRAFRIPLSRRRAYFFDVNGTLADANGRISEAKREVIAGLSRRHRIYLVTSLPFSAARIICRSIWGYLDGGVFAEGADLRIFRLKYRHVIPLRDSFCEGSLRIKTDAGEVSKSESGYSRIREYRSDGMLYKVSLPETAALNLSEQQRQTVHVVCEDGRIGITARGADKLHGILHICERMGYREDEVHVVGNSGNDIEMLRYFRHSYAVPGSAVVVREAAGCVCRVEDMG